MYSFTQLIDKVGVHFIIHYSVVGVLRCKKKRVSDKIQALPVTVTLKHKVVLMETGTAKAEVRK